VARCSGRRRGSTEKRGRRTAGAGEGTAVPEPVRRRGRSSPPPPPSQ
jgi:hypothetical protein